MGIWGAGTATAGTMQAGASIANTILSYQHAKKLQNHQYDLNRRALREYYSNTRHSLESAGYNPLLATQQSAQGFSASSGGTPSTIGDGVADAITSAMSYKQAKEQIKKTKEETKGVELDNKIKEKELTFSPKSIVSDFVRGNNNPVVDFVKQVGSKLGISSNSAESTLRNDSKYVPVIKLHDGKGYVQKGVPKSVVKSFNQQNSAVSSQRLREMSDDEIRRYKPSKRRYNSPPREYPR